jgi:hypothetical protein
VKLANLMIYLSPQQASAFAQNSCELWTEGATGARSNKVMYSLLDKLDHGSRYVLHEVCVALIKLGMGWSEITQQVMMRTSRPVMRESTLSLASGGLADSSHAEWLAASEALGNEYVAASEEAMATVVPELERILNNGDVTVSVAGATALGRVGAGDKVLEYCAEWLQPEQSLENRLSSMKALRGLGVVQREMVAAGTASDRIVTQREATLEGLVELLRDEDISVRMSAGSALIALKHDDTEWARAVAHVTKLIVRAGDGDAGTSEVVELARWLSMMQPLTVDPGVAAKLHAVIKTAEWTAGKSAAASLTKLAPGDGALQELLVAWVRAEMYDQQLEGVVLLGLVGAAYIGDHLPKVVAVLLPLLRSLDRTSPLAVAVVETFGTLQAAPEEVIQLFIEIITEEAPSPSASAVGAGDAVGSALGPNATAPIKGAALTAIAQLPDPPKQLSSLINSVLLKVRLSSGFSGTKSTAQFSDPCILESFSGQAEVGSWTLWEAAAKGLRAKVWSLLIPNSLLRHLSSHTVLLSCSRDWSALGRLRPGGRCSEAADQVAVRRVPAAKTPK